MYFKIKFETKKQKSKSKISDIAGVYLIRRLQQIYFFNTY